MTPATKAADIRDMAASTKYLVSVLVQMVTQLTVRELGPTAKHKSKEPTWIIVLSLINPVTELGSTLPPP